MDNLQKLIHKYGQPDILLDSCNPSNEKYAVWGFDEIIEINHKGCFVNNNKIKGDYFKILQNTISKWKSQAKDEIACIGFISYEFKIFIYDYINFSKSSDTQFPYLWFCKPKTVRQFSRVKVHNHKLGQLTITDDIIKHTECDCNVTKDLHNKNYSDMVTYMEDTDVLTASDETSSSDGAFEGAELEDKISLLQRFLTWLSDPANAESDVVVNSDEDDVEKITAEVEEITLMADEINEGDDIDMNIDELTAALGTVIDEKLASHSEASAAQVETLIEDKLASAINAMTEKQDELTAKVDESAKSVTDSIDEISTRVETVENSGAIKKSVDETDEEEDVAVKAAVESVPESFWGTFSYLRT